MARSSASKMIKKARKSVPIGRKRSPLAKAIPAGGSALLGVAGSIAVSKAAKNISGKVSRGGKKLGKAGQVGERMKAVGDAVSTHKTTVGKAAAALKEVGKSGASEGTAQTKLRHIIQERITVAVPRRTAYNQWTQFEEFGKIFKAVQSTDQKEDDAVKWTAKIGPSTRQWTGEIVDQTSDERIEWKTTGGTIHRGVVTFHSLDDRLTEVLVEIEYHPEGFLEKTGNLLRIQRRRVRRDLMLFKHFLELRGKETGAWRGEIAKEGDRARDESPEDLASDKDHASAG